MPESRVFVLHVQLALHLRVGNFAPSFEGKRKDDQNTVLNDVHQWRNFLGDRHKADHCQPQIGNKLMDAIFFTAASLFFVLRSSLQESSFTDDDECRGLNGEECLIKRSLIAHTDYIYTQRNVGP
ncbi:hypothetical protein PVK06_009033 [Gossypium arboreum]|uniref:Phytosulfokine n=1 Tax=Gossypium arboreum TaxID=29729 RepID=A0ABR0QLG2_GOSAR|nr:hypothetical protein PVK06_009033 [Gossypium arboreum]